MKLSEKLVSVTVADLSDLLQLAEKGKNFNLKTGEFEYPSAFRDLFDRIHGTIMETILPADQQKKKYLDYIGR